MAVGIGGVVGIVGGVLFFQGVRRFARRAETGRRDLRRLVFGLAWRLAAVAVLVGLVAYAGGSPGAVAVLVGLVLARLIVRRGSG
ncbi:hypothetical protein [Thiohalorhabdus sp.]|uniref:hypothetical protein n=1 Tax=Thiohalorhabdus sp. TaxID=3094134 RepID=UPI002FC307AB